MKRGPKLPKWRREISISGGKQALFFITTSTTLPLPSRQVLYVQVQSLETSAAFLSSPPAHVEKNGVLFHDKKRRVAPSFCLR